MTPFRHVLRGPLPVALIAALWSSLGRAQSAGLDPESPLVSAPSTPADRGVGVERERAGTRRRDHFSVGALGGVGFPRPLSIEGAVKLERVLLLGAEYSALPSITLSNVSVSYWAVAGDVRVFPLHGPFFLGLRAGRQYLAAETSLSAYGYTVPAAAAVATTFLNPRLGFMWTWEPGITLGINAGVQIPLSSTASSTLPSTSSSVIVANGVTSAQQTLDDMAAAIGQTTLPTVDLVQAGILF